MGLPKANAAQSTPTCEGTMTVPSTSAELRIREVDFSTGLMIALTPDLRIVAVSDRFCTECHRDRSKLIGHGIFEVYAECVEGPDAGPCVLRRSLERVMRERGDDLLDTRNYRIRPTQPSEGVLIKHGWRVRNTPIFDEFGHLIFILHQIDESARPSVPAASQTKIEPAVSTQSAPEYLHLARCSLPHPASARPVNPRPISTGGTRDAARSVLAGFTVQPRIVWSN